MEKETIDLIGGLIVLVLLIGCLGIGFYALHVTSSSKEKKMDHGEVVHPVNAITIPCDKPFEKLWNDSGCCVSFHMDGGISGRLCANEINRVWELPDKYDTEEIYRDAILNLVKDGAIYRESKTVVPISKANDPELRKFCITNAPKLFPVQSHIHQANVLYEYINTGKFKEKED